MVAQYPFTRLPDHTQLSESDGTFVKNFLEHPQSILLTDALQPYLEQLHPDGQYCIGQDCGIYWRQTDPPEPPERGAEAPDWFYVPNVPPLLNGEYRRSYVMWRELIAPLIVIEFVSGNGTEERDTTPGIGKFWIYEQVIHPSYYVIYDAKLGQLEVYEMLVGRYCLVRPDEHGHFPIERLGLSLGIWQAKFMEMTLPWMRWYDSEGILLPLSKERAALAEERAELAEERAELAEEEAQQERQRAEQEHQRAEQAQEETQKERQRAAALAERLRMLGIDPDTI